MTSCKPWAIIVGGGPSGLLLGLMLAKKGVPVHILESAAELDDSPRAAYYGNPAAFELQRAGVIDEIRKLDGTYLAGFDNTLLHDDPDRPACLPLAQLDRLLYKHVIAQPSATVSFNQTVVDVGQDSDKAWVDVETPDGKKRLEAAYIIGCDGASSTALENDEFFKMLRSIENNPEAQREFMRSANALRYDFTQHYKTSNRDHVKENGGSHNNGPVVAIGAD